MRSDPSPDILGTLDDLEESMAIMHRDYYVEVQVDAVLLINRSRADRIQDLYMPRRYRTPYRGFPI
eukprot:11242402-Karenia_brevis.AAC.1